MIGINPGRLKTAFTLQVRRAARDATGGRAAESWADVETVWGELTPLAGWEGDRVKQVDAELTHRVVLRYRSDLTSRHRLKVGTTILNIKGPPRDVGNAHAILELDCIQTEA